MALNKGGSSVELQVVALRGDCFPLGKEGPLQGTPCN